MARRDRKLAAHGGLHARAWAVEPTATPVRFGVLRGWAAHEHAAIADHEVGGHEKWVLHFAATRWAVGHKVISALTPPATSKMSLVAAV